MLDDLVEGELDAAFAERVNLHVFACSECAFRFETLKREKEMYAYYLFDVEPPIDLLAKFQAKLAAENARNFGSVQTPVVSRKANIFGFFRFPRLSPVLASVIAFAAFAAGLTTLRFASSERISGDKNFARTESSIVQPAIVESDKTVENGVINLSDERKNGDEIASLKSAANAAANKIPARKFVSMTNIKSVVLKTTGETIKLKNSAVSVGEKRFSAKDFGLSEEERMQSLYLKNLEKETAVQIEKIEMLLRSFRNARSAENSESFDVAYERDQARKLLRKNVRLRQDVESYGILYTEELLGRVEPLLLDIANLENNASSEKVRDIKDRVKNQNIIASLQVYR